MKKNLIPFLIWFCFLSCAVSYLPSARFDEVLYNQQLEKWQNLNITDYSFDWCIHGNTPNEDIFGFVTRKGESFTVNISYDKDFFNNEKIKNEIPKEGDETYLTSIEDTFFLIKSTYNAQKKRFDKGELYAVNATANYNKEYNFPEYASIDIENGPIKEGTIGDRSFLSFSVTNFTILE